ncbi:MAG: oligosaccharide repeat unit polymerase [Prevotellaceae bacterium]|jgi:oligosaccharide repeat unit polymerase|nr:oligosaccharide repeat unit polymerase [Prevotellaceae bacterium]
MIYILIIIAILIIVVGLISTRDNIFSPSVITAAVWLCCLVLFQILPHNLPLLTTQFTISLLFWLALLSVSSLWIQPIAIKNQTAPTQASKLVRNIYLVISIISLIFFLFWVKNVMSNGFSAGWAGKLRNAALGNTADSTEVYAGMQVLIWYISMILELLYVEKKRWYRLAIPMFCCLAFGFFTMSKSMILNVIITTLCVLFFKKIVKVSHVATSLIVLFVFFLGFQTLRQNQEIKANSFTTIYMLSSMTAFDMIKPKSAEHFGENTFRIYYAITYKLGLSDTKPVEIILKFIKKPIHTNIYTGMYPFFKDFGLFGVIIFAILYGLLYGYLFARAKCGNMFCIGLYSYLAYAIAIQFTVDLPMTNIAGYLKFTIFLAIPFLAEKYKLFYKKEKTPEIT